MLKRRSAPAEGNPWETVQELNLAWRTGDVDRIDDLFHPDVVIVHPGFEERTEGRDACVQSYIDFAMQSTVSRLEEFDPQVDIVGDTAIVNYGFEIDYEVQGKAFRESGTDVFVLVNVDGRWLVAWRTLVMDE